MCVDLCLCVWCCMCGLCVFVSVVSGGLFDCAVCVVWVARLCVVYVL